MGQRRDVTGARFQQCFRSGVVLVGADQPATFDHELGTHQCQFDRHQNRGSDRKKHDPASHDHGPEARGSVPEHPVVFSIGPFLIEKLFQLLHENLDTGNRRFEFLGELITHSIEGWTAESPDHDFTLDDRAILEQHLHRQPVEVINRLIERLLILFRRAAIRVVGGLDSGRSGPPGIGSTGP